MSEAELGILRAMGQAEQAQQVATADWIHERCGCDVSEIPEALGCLQEGYFRGQAPSGVLIGHAQLLVSGRKYLARLSGSDDPIVQWLVRRDQAVLRALDTSRELRDRPDAESISRAAGVSEQDAAIALDVLEDAGLIVSMPALARSPYTVGVLAAGRLSVTEKGREELRGSPHQGMDSVGAMSGSEGSRVSKDFFISYTAADRAWAEWIAWQLEEAGYTTILQAWDFGPGSDFVVEMDRATKVAERTIAVLSQQYLNSAPSTAEWAARFREDPTGKDRRLLPVRVQACEVAGLLGEPA